MSIVIDRILQLLKEQNKSQRELAIHLGVTETVISGWKKGQSHSYYSYINKIAEFLEADNAELDKLVAAEKAAPREYSVYKHVSPSIKNIK